MLSRPDYSDEKGRGAARWYDLGVTPTLDRFFGALPMLKKAVASLRGYEERRQWEPATFIVGVAA